MNPYFTEVTEAHKAIELWLSRGEGGILPLLARFSPDYTMVPLSGVPFGFEALNRFFSTQGGSRPGLTITVDSLTLLAEWSTGAVVGYREIQQTAQETTVRWSTALFVLNEGKPQWRHLHETAQA